LRRSRGQSSEFIAAMTVLIVAPYFPPDSNQSALMYSGLAADLASRGEDVTVITTEPHYAVCGKRRIGRPYREETWCGARIIRVYVPHLGRWSLWRRIVTLLCFNTLGALFLLFQRSPAAAVIPNPAFLSIGIAAVLSLRGIPIHFRIHDLYPEIAVRLGVVPPEGLAAHWIGGMERACIRRAARVSVVTEAFREHLVKRGVARNRTELIPDWVDTERIRVSPRCNAFSREHGLDGQFVLMYGGNVGLSQRLDVLLDAAEILQNSGTEGIRVLIIGGGAAKQRLMRVARDKLLRNVTFLPCQPAELLNEVYAACDAGFVSLMPGLSPEWCPAKVYTVMASGRPVLAAVDIPRSEVHNVVTNSGAGICVQAGDAHAVARAVLVLMADRAATAEFGRRGRLAAERLYARQSCTRALHKTIQLACRQV